MHTCLRTQTYTFKSVVERSVVSKDPKLDDSSLQRDQTSSNQSVRSGVAKRKLYHGNNNAIEPPSQFLSVGVYNTYISLHQNITNTSLFPLACSTRQHGCVHHLLIRTV